MSSTGVTSSIRAASVRLSQIYSQSKAFGNAGSRIDLMYIACTHEHRQVRRLTPVFLPRRLPPNVGAKKLKWSCHLDVKILFWNASTAKNRVDGIEGDWKNLENSPGHLPTLTDPAFFDTLSLYVLTMFFIYAPFRNTNDGRRFTNEHSLDAFQPRAQNRGE